MAFVDSTAAIERARTDSVGPGQRFAVASMEVCSRVRDRDNKATICWVPAHGGIIGNESGRLRQICGQGGASCEEVPDECRWETSLSHMTRLATEASLAAQASG